MSRQLRIEYPGATYHVMSRGTDRGEVFRDDRDRMRFLELLAAAVRFGHLDVHSYALMSTHFHLLCETPHGDLSQIVGTILGTYTRNFNLRHGRTGRLWEGRFRSILVGPGLYFLDCSRYIHLNPCKAGIVEHPSDYMWSSFRNYAGLPNLAPWVKRERVRGYFRKPHEYMNYVETGMRIPPVDPFEAAQLRLVYGDEQFLREIREMASHLNPNSEIPALQGLQMSARRHDPSRIFQAVRNQAPNLSEAVTIRLYVYSLFKFTLLSGKDIAGLVGLSPSAAGKIRKRFDRQRNSSPELKRTMEAIEAQLKIERENAKLPVADLPGPGK